MYYNNRDIRIEEMNIPRVGPKEVLMKVMASGICGSDVMEWYRIHKAPLVLGHEVAGQIVEVGKDVTTYKVGDRISASHHVPCYICHYCLNGHTTVCETLRRTNFIPGGFSEYVLLPEINVKHGIYLLPDSVSYEEGSFVEPLACVVRGQRLAHMEPGKTVLVIGSGIAGMLHINLARALGAGTIIAVDIHEFRLNMAKRSGADYTIHALEYSPDRLREINEGRLADLVIVCTGNPSAIEQGLRSIDKGGTMLFFAATGKDVKIPFSFNEILFKNEITITSSYAGDRRDHLTALEMIYHERVNVKDMITHRLSLEDIQKGFSLVQEGKQSLKIIIEPQR